MTTREQQPTSAIDELFEQALELDPSDRAAFIEEVARDDPNLRAELESLLDAHTRAPAWLSPEDDPAEADGPRRIGKYTLRSVIGSGGMGIVYLATQQQPRRRVALKLFRQGVASRSAMRRFEFESQILGRLRHPNILQVHDAGKHDDGSGAVPYFVMEYIPNAKTITEYAASKKLPLEDRLLLFAKVCDAVHHGHQRGIIHRDLKPGNILVDSGGVPKVIDFGVARATDSDMAVTTLQTDIGQLIGTLQYMSPEQLESDPSDIDTRADVYALGVVLYELLCERLPYDVTSTPIHEAARIIRDQQPARLSAMNRKLSGDLETITLKALQKEPDRRYASANDLRLDLERRLANEPIAARPPNVAYQMSTFARRNKALVSGVIATFVVLVAGLIGTSAMYLRARTAEADAELRAAELESEIGFKDSQFADLDEALLLSNTNRKSEAVESLRAALEERRASLGNDDPFTLQAMMNLGVVLGHTLTAGDQRERREQQVEAQRYLLQALLGFRRVLGDRDPRTIMCMSRTARVLHSLDRPEEALQLSEEAAIHAEAVMSGQPDKSVAKSMAKVFEQRAYILMGSGRFQQAEAVYLREFAILDSLDSVYRRKRISASQLVRLYNTWHKAEPGQGFDAKAAEWREKTREIANDSAE